MLLPDSFAHNFTDRFLKNVPIFGLETSVVELLVLLTELNKKNVEFLSANTSDAVGVCRPSHNLNQVDMKNKIISGVARGGRAGGASVGALPHTPPERGGFGADPQLGLGGAPSYILAAKPPRHLERSPNSLRT